MSNRTKQLTDHVYDYLLQVSVRESDEMRDLRIETAGLEQSMMQVAPEQAQFMALLVKLIGARRCIEVGVFTGYSTLAVAQALGADGRIVACDVSEEWTAIGERHWQLAGVRDRIDLRLAPAVDTLDALLADGGAGQFDFAFIDADKVNYPAYYEKALTLLRVGGLVAIDNVLWSGKVADPTELDDDTVAIRSLNETIKNDDRVDLSLVPIADGLTLARKR
jgi:predicted O-methyltransferase YrrM